MNVEALLEPIDGGDPCGADLSFSREFDAVEESRRADDPTLAQGGWTRPLKSADWRGAALQCEALLRHRTKDLRVAVWLTDALSRTQGFPGLADGLRLCVGLCEAWWDSGLHPRPDESGDASGRVGSLDWLLGRVVGAAGTAPVLRDGERAFGLHELEAARASEETADDDLARAEAATPPEFRAANLAAVRSAGESLARLQTFVDARLGDDGPAFAAARKALDDALRQVERLARARLPEAPLPLAVHGTPRTAAADPPPAAAGAPQSREQALQQLRAVADFFRRTEPHSPVAYLAEKAAAWGAIPLHEWLRAVVKDAAALAQMEELLGVPRPPE